MTTEILQYKNTNNDYTFTQSRQLSRFLCMIVVVSRVRLLITTPKRSLVVLQCTTLLHFQSDMSSLTGRGRVTFREASTMKTTTKRQQNNKSSPIQ